MPEVNEDMDDLGAEMERLQGEASKMANPDLDLQQDMDLSDVEIKDFAILSKDRYPLVVKSVELKKSGKVGENGQQSNYLELVLSVTTGEHKNRQIWDRLMLSGKAQFRFVKFIDAIGMYDSTNKRFTGAFSSFVGEKLWGHVDIEPEKKEIVDGVEKTYKARNIVGFSQCYEPIGAYALPLDQATQVANELEQALAAQEVIEEVSSQVETVKKELTETADEKPVVEVPAAKTTKPVEEPAKESVTTGGDAPPWDS